jgi:hypothetical protein
MFVIRKVLTRLLIKDGKTVSARESFGFSVLAYIASDWPAVAELRRAASRHRVARVRSAASAIASELHVALAAAFLASHGRRWLVTLQALSAAAAVLLRKSNCTAHWELTVLTLSLNKQRYRLPLVASCKPTPFSICVARQWWRIGALKPIICCQKRRQRHQ